MYIASLKFFLLIYLAGLDLSCGMWDLVLWPGIEPSSSAMEAQSLSHWTSREVLSLSKYDEASTFCCCIKCSLSANKIVFQRPKFCYIEFLDILGIKPKVPSLRLYASSETFLSLVHEWIVSFIQPIHINEV